ncbi:pseudouridine synthase [Pseudooceanicola sp. 200-1SW]|uniref:pseudouridine synthase n=1 Tax=Pseudooceanicola sp. 200-1SW TaxID=3425949 RepID=UPI003D7FD7AC
MSPKKPTPPGGAPRPDRSAKPGRPRRPGPKGSATPPAAAPTPGSGSDRIAKVMARAGLASRRDAEKIVEAGRVSVNGKVITSPALNVTAADRITVDGKPLGPAEPPRVWLYHKPTGLVTTAKDEQGRETVFDALPEDLPRVMSVGRLDLNSEGLLLLTNDGEVKRRLELPETGWVRKYRVRVKGAPSDATLAPLREGVVVDGEHFQPMQVSLDRQQGANAWLTVGLREGRNREIRRAMENVGLVVNRLIRVSYGPFQLGTLKAGEVEELRPRVLRDQLGIEIDPDAAPRPKRQPRKGAEAAESVPARGFAGQGSRGGAAKGPGRSGGKGGGAARGLIGRAEAPRGKTVGKPGGPGKDRARVGDGSEGARPGGFAPGKARSGKPGAGKPGMGGKSGFGPRAGAEGGKPAGRGPRGGSGGAGGPGGRPGNGKPPRGPRGGR